MKDQYIGTTETGEIAFDLEAFEHLHEANIIITKRLTSPLIQRLVENKEKIILHLTCTGWGGSKVEPLVPTADTTRAQFKKLIRAGFPLDQVVLRIDPVILTKEGVERLNHVLDLFEDSGIKRYRVSYIDMYRHAKVRFNEAGIELPHETFHAPIELRRKVTDQLVALGKETGFDVELCGEPGLDSTPCVSQKDIDILGLTGKITLVGNAQQRDACGCPANKKQILTKRPGRCANKCLYCYWKD